MEPRLYFSAFVLMMCALHLVWTASAWINTRWGKRARFSNNQAAITKNSKGILPQKQAPQRSDWYAFFHCSDLVGRDRAKPAGPFNNQNKSKKAQKSRQFRRLTA
jgi:poly-D-alanine transfer protein DltD